MRYLKAAVLAAVLTLLVCTAVQADMPSESYQPWQTTTGTMSTAGDANCSQANSCLVMTNAILGSVSFQFNSGFTGVVSFEATTDSLTYNPVHCYNAPAGSSPATSTSTFPSQWMCPGGAFRVIRARVTTASSGSMTASGLASAMPAPANFSLGASTVPTPDATMQGTTLLNVTQTSGSAAANTITIAGAPNQRVTVRALACYITGATPAAATITIKDGATTIMDLGTRPSSEFTIAATNYAPFLPSSTGLTMTTGNNAVITVGAQGASTTTTCSVSADRS